MLTTVIIAKLVKTLPSAESVANNGYDSLDDGFGFSLFSRNNHWIHSILNISNFLQQKILGFKEKQKQNK